MREKTRLIRRFVVSFIPESFLELAINIICYLWRARVAASAGGFTEGTRQHYLPGCEEGLLSKLPLKLAPEHQYCPRVNCWLIQ